MRATLLLSNHPLLLSCWINRIVQWAPVKVQPWAKTVMWKWNRPDSKIWKTSSSCSKWKQEQNRTSFTKDQSIGNRQSWDNLLLAATWCFWKRVVLSLIFKRGTKMHLRNIDVFKWFCLLPKGRVAQISFYSWKAPSVSCIHTSTWTDDLNPFHKLAQESIKQHGPTQPGWVK